METPEKANRTTGISLLINEFAFSFMSIAIAKHKTMPCLPAMELNSIYRWEDSPGLGKLDACLANALAFQLI